MYAPLGCSTLTNGTRKKSPKRVKCESPNLIGFQVEVGKSIFLGSK